MRRETKGARRYNEQITLTKTTSTVELGHVVVSDPVVVLTVFASVRQMSATKTMATFQQIDVVGVDIEMRKPSVDFDGIIWRGHDIHFPTPEDVDNRGRVLRISGWYQADNPHV